MKEITITFYTNSCSLYNDLHTLCALPPSNGFKSDTCVHASAFKGTLGLRSFHPNRTYTQILVKICPFVIQYM